MPYKTQTITTTNPKQNSGWKQTQTQTPKQEEQKGDIIEIIAKFLFFTESINKNTGLPVEGETKEGKPYKQWDVVFNKQGAQQNKVFKVFNDLSGKSLRLNELVSGQDYKLLYEQGIIKVKANRLFWVGKPLGEPKKPVIPPKTERTIPNTPTQNKPFKTPVNQLQVAPEFKQVWDANDFSSKQEWMSIAENSNLFDNEKEAEQVWDILSNQ